MYRKIVWICSIIFLLSLTACHSEPPVQPTAVGPEAQNASAAAPKMSRDEKIANQNGQPRQEPPAAVVEARRQQMAEELQRGDGCAECRRNPAGEHGQHYDAGALCPQCGQVLDENAPHHCPAQQGSAGNGPCHDSDHCAIAGR